MHAPRIANTGAGRAMRLIRHNTVAGAAVCCRRRVRRLEAATSEFLVCRVHETRSRLHVTSTIQEWVRHVADTCHMQEASRARDDVEVDA
jgi:hypothetical protein